MPGAGVAMGAAIVLAAVAACDGGDAQLSVPAADQPDASRVALVPEAFLTARDTLLNIDSPAVWHGPAGQHWLLSTAKAGNVIRVEDAADGTFLRDVGGEGTGPGQFRRPNGIAVLDDLLLVVERDNARVQVLSLPDFQPLGDFGQPELRLPYGVSAHRAAPGEYIVYVTDNYEIVPDQVPPDSLLGERVRSYRLQVGDGRASAELVAAFGETSGAGVLRVVESIMADPATGRLLVAEELEGESQIKVYTLDGRFAGTTIPISFFRNQAEGIVLYACDGDDGYWITTDQGRSENTFHVFDRVSLQHRGSFGGPHVLNTDGIALTQRAFADFPAGAFYAVHDDGNVAAFSWQSIASALQLRSDCLPVD